MKSTDTKSEVLSVVLQDETVDLKDGNHLFNYADISLCWMCYNVVEAPANIKAEGKCCMEFSLNGVKTYACSDAPSTECAEPIKSMTKKFYT